MNKTTILIVDDDVEVRNIIQHVLKTLDYNLLIAEDGFHALQKLNDHHVDIIIADQRMPGMTGLSLLKEVKKLYPDITRLLITGYLEVDVFKEAINVGEIYKMIIKPFNVEELCKIIEQTVEYHDSKVINKEFIDKLEQEVKLFFQSFFNSGDAIIITDRQARIKYVNQEFLKLYGYNLNEVIGENPWNFLTSENYTQNFKNILLASEDPSAGSWKGEINYRHKNGNLIPALGSVIPLRDHNGKITNYLCIAYDMTPQKTLENRLRKSEKKYRGIIHDATDGIFQVGLNGKFNMVNPAFKKIFKYESNKKFLKEKELSDIFCDPDDVVKIFSTHKKHDTMANFEVKMKRMNNEEFFGALNTQKVAGDDGKATHIQGFIRDISAEKQMRELNERMQRLEALGQLAAGLAHEIRNPIASMKLNLQFLQRKYYADKFFQENIVEVFEAMLRVEKIMEQTLYFAGKKRPTLIPEKVLPLINRSIELIKMELFELNSDITINCPDDFPNLMLDKQQFLQVMVNLIKNSLQSIDTRGKIKISCYLKNIDKKQKAVIEIIDNGKGMTEEECNRVFNPFFTTKSTGVGLGLSIVYKLLGQHYASIDLKSKINRGTTFSLFFPLKIPKEN